MDKIIRSYNTTALGLNPLRFVRPDAPQLFFYGVVELLLFLALNASSFRKLLEELIGHQDLSNLSVWQSLSSSNLVPVLFWGGCGCLVYLGLWILKTVLNNIRNDIAVAYYAHPATYKEYLYWRSILLRRLFFAVSILTLLGYVYSFFKVMILLQHFAYWRFGHIGDPRDVIQLVGVLATSLLLIHILTLLLRLSANAWQFIYKDL